FCCASSSLIASTESLTSPPLVSIASYLKVGMAVSPHSPRLAGGNECPRQAGGYVLGLIENGLADDFLDGSDAVVDGTQAGLAQADHAVTDARRPQFVGRGAVGDQVADVVVDDNQFVDAGAAAVAGVVAAVAAAAVIEFLALDVLRAQTQLHEHLG